MTESSPPRGPRLAWLTFLTYYAIVSFGLCIVITGSALPHVIRSLGLSASQTGFLTSMWSLGFLLFTAMAGSFADRIANEYLLGAGSVMIAASVCLFGRTHDFLLNLFLQFTLGGGAGIYEGTLNALTVRLYPSSRTAALNVLHAMLGIGTVCGPMLTASIVGAGWDYKYAFVAVGAFSILLLPMVLFTRFPRFQAEPDRGAPVESALSRVTRLLRHPAFFLPCAGMAFYVGVEYGTNTWVTTYLTEVKGAAFSSANAILSLFWGGLLVGRLLTGLVARIARSGTIVVGLSALCLVAFALGLRSVSPFALQASFALFGLAMSGIFPTLLSMSSEDHPELAGSAMGILVALGNLGGFVIPWAIASTFASIGIDRGMHLYLIDILFLIGVTSLYATTRTRRAPAPAINR